MQNALAAIAGFKLGKCFAPLLHLIRELEQERAAVGGRGSGPALESPARDSDGAIHLIRGRLGDDCDRTTTRRVVDGLGRPLASDQPATNEQRLIHIPPHSPSGSTLRHASRQAKLHARRATLARRVKRCELTVK